MNKAILASPIVVLSLAVHLAFAADDAAADASAAASAADAKAKQAKQAHIFKAADTNGDGGISRSELAKTTSVIFESMKANFDQMDVNKDGKVTLEEVEAWQEAERKAQFEQMDANHDGKVTPEERDKWITAQRYRFGK